MYMQITVLLSVISLLLGSATVAHLWSAKSDIGSHFLNAYFRHFLAFSTLAVTGAICVYWWSNFTPGDTELRRLVALFLVATLPMNLTVMQLGDPTQLWRHHRLLPLAIAALGLPILGFIFFQGWLSWLMLAGVIGSFIVIQVWAGMHTHLPDFPEQKWFGPSAFLTLVSAVLVLEVSLVWFSRYQGGYFSASLAVMYSMEALRAVFMTRQVRKEHQRDDASFATPAHTAEDFDLTSREQEVIAAVLRGLSNKQIAYELDVTENTVRNHLSRIFRKVGIHKRTELFSTFGVGVHTNASGTDI